MRDLRVGARVFQLRRATHEKRSPRPFSNRFFFRQRLACFLHAKHPSLVRFFLALARSFALVPVIPVAASVKSLLWDRYLFSPDASIDFPPRTKRRLLTKRHTHIYRSFLCPRDALACLIFSYVSERVRDIRPKELRGPFSSDKLLTGISSRPYYTSARRTVGRM